MQFCDGAAGGCAVGELGITGSFLIEPPYSCR